MLPDEPGSPLIQNPFHVLGLPPTASRAEVEREGLRLLGTLEAGLTGASQYRCPLGTRERSADLVRRAMAALRDPTQRLLDEVWAGSPAAQGTGEDSPTTEALALHAECLRKKPDTLEGADVSLLLAAWESALADHNLRRILAERALEVGLPPTAPSADGLLARIRDQVAEDVAAVMLRGRVPLGDVEVVGDIGVRTCRMVRDELLNRIQVASRALKQRVRDGREIPVDSERWEWVTLRHLYQETVHQGGMELRHLAWDEFHSSLMDLVVWLWNQRKELTLSDEIEHWLLEEARALHDQRSVDQHVKNLKDSRPRGRVAPAMAPPSEAGRPPTAVPSPARPARKDDPAFAWLLTLLLMLLFFVVLLTVLVRLGGVAPLAWTEQAPRVLGLVGLCWWLRRQRPGL